MNADGTGLTMIIDTASNEWAPEWSPDGTRIAFITDRDGNDEVYVMGADGSNPTRLTNTPEHEAFY